MGVLDNTEFKEPVEEYLGPIGEMGGDDIATDLPVPADFMEQIRKSDDDPMFVTVEVASGVSKSKRKWKPEHVHQTVAKVNKERMGGNLGHPLLDPKAYDSAFPIPQVVWFAAKAQEMGGRTVGKFKGYVLKNAEARELLRLKLIDGVSWFGDVKGKRLPDGTLDVIHFDPETIDFARKGRSGMPSRVLALAGEQEPRGGNGVEPRDIAALSEDELKTHNPLLYAKIQTDAKGDLETKAGEMTEALAAAKPEVDMMAEIRKLLGLQEGENAIEKLTTFIGNAEEAAKDEIRTFVRSIVGKKVKTKRGQDVVVRLLGGEMETWEAMEPTDENKKTIETAVESKLESDKTLSALVGEMSTWEDPAENEGEEDDKNKKDRTGGTRFGSRSRVGEMAGRTNSEEKVGAGSVVKDTGRLKVTRRRFGQ